MTPNQVNRVHWPTKENRQAHIFVCLLSVHGKNLPGMAPNGAGKLFFRPIQTFPTFWATWIWILRFSIFSYMFLDSKFLDFQVPRFPKSGPGQAWAGPGWTLACELSTVNMGV